MVPLHTVGARKIRHSLTRCARTQTKATSLLAVQLYSRYSPVTKFNDCPDQRLYFGTPLTVLLRAGFPTLLKQGKLLVCREELFERMVKGFQPFVFVRRI